MEMQTIAIGSFIGVIFSIILSVGAPIVLLVVGKKKYNAKISSFFIGAVTFLLFAMSLEQILHAIVIGILGLNPQSHEWLYYLYAAAAAAVFEETGRIVAMKFFMKKSFNFPNAFMYGIGHGGVEAILIGGIAGLSNLVSMIMVNSGAMETSLAMLPQETQVQTVEQLSALWTTPSGLFFVSGIERVSAIILHIGLSLIIYYGLKEKNKLAIIAAFMIHFVVDFFAVSCASRMPIWLLECIVFAMVAATFMFSHRLNKGAEETNEADED